MSTFTIQSQNPQASFVFGKNPQTQIDTNQPFKRHNCYMVYEDHQKVTLHTPDKKTANYLSMEYINGGTTYLNMVEEHLQHILKGKSEHDGLYPCEIKLNLYTHNNLGFKHYSPEKIDEVIDTHISKMVIKGNNIQDALGVMVSLCILSIAHDKDIKIQDTQFLKYIPIALSSGMSYRSIRTIINTLTDYKVYKALIPTFEQYNMMFQFGNALQSRIEYYRNNPHLKTRASELLDIGVGEGNYIRYHGKLYDKFIGIDSEETEIDKAKNKLAKYQLQDKGTIIHQNAIEYLGCSNYEDNHQQQYSLKDKDVLMTEVIEHMSKDNSIQLIRTILCLNPTSLIMTIPNYAFNEYYGLKNGEFRHDDHEWECTQDDIEMIKGDLDKHSMYNYHIDQVGDIVNGISSAYGITITLK